MTNEQKKKYLSRYINCLGEMQQMEELRDRLYSIPSQIITDMPKAQSRGDKLESAVCEMLSKEEKFIATKIEELTELKMETYRIIDALRYSNQIQVMYYRYIFGLKWEEICVKMNYSWRQTHRIHSSALKNVVIKDGTKWH